MNLYDDYDPFAYGDDDLPGKPDKEESETRRKYFEEELIRYSEEKRSSNRDYTPRESKQRAFRLVATSRTEQWTRPSPKTQCTPLPIRLQ